MHTPRSNWLLATMLACLAVFSPLSLAQSNPDAVALLKKVDELYRSDSAEATLKMEIVTPNWQRTLSMQSWSVGMDDTFIRILSPAKDRGVATLKKGNEMWNYFPKINKVIKVPPSMMMGSWMGSDFTNDDLVRESSYVKDYDVTMTASETEYTLSLVPKARTVTVWDHIDIIVDKASLLPKEQSYFNEKGEKVRTLTFSEVKTFSNKQIPSRMTMVPNNKEGHQTVVIYEALKLDAPVDNSVFTLRNLQKRF